MKYLDIIIGSEKDYTLENRIMNTILALAGLVGILSVLSDILMQERITLILISAAISLCYIILYFLNRRFSFHSKIIYPFTILQILTILYIWYNFDGISGTSNLFYLTFIFLIPIITKGRNRILLLMFLGSFSLFFLFVEMRNPNLVKSFSGYKTELLSTFFTSLFISLALLGLLIIVFNSYTSKRKQVEELNKTKDKFFSIIAHDLKGPIASLMQLGAHMKNSDKQLSPENKNELTNAIYTSSKNTYELLENLLQWARSESGALEAHPEKINLKETVSNILLLLNERLTEKKISIHINIEPMLFVFSDPNMLNTVIRNLISNAIKFSFPEGNIIISSKKAKMGYVDLLIQDNGIGIEESALVKLFDLDSKYRQAGTQNETGTGLGLKLCKEFILKNNGTIAVESVVNNGSLFKISLPAA